MYPRPLPQKKKGRTYKRKHAVLSIGLVLLAVIYSAIAFTRPFDQLTPSITNDTLQITTQASSLPWPSYGQGAFGLSTGKIIATRGEQEQVATASTAKLITSLVVLERKPITNGSGPTITMTDADVALYKQYVAKQGSVMPVYAGQKLTERQMLEAILLPSGNNVSDSLAIWAYGSIDAYLTAANKYLQTKGLTNTKVATDASGYSSDSVSTASDLVKIGALAMNNPIIASVVSEKTAAIPDVGTIRNVNAILGSNGIVGVKTGNNDQNTGVFVGATTAQVGGKTITIISALSGAPNLATVLRDSNTFLAAARTTFADTNIVAKGTVLGTYAQADGQSLQAIAADDLSTVVLRGDTVSAKVLLQPISINATANQVVGSVSLPATNVTEARSINVILKEAPTKPSAWYRLTHP
jgi:serine-type D-Ala-D-Ala carboxypeptidase (penicillin-binding protein 5/6)